jgi:hypothetical protein
VVEPRADEGGSCFIWFRYGLCLPGSTRSTAANEHLHTSPSPFLEPSPAAVMLHTSVVIHNNALIKPLDLHS